MQFFETPTFSTKQSIFLAYTRPVGGNDPSAGWQRLSHLAGEGDALKALQETIVRVRFGPTSQDLRRQLGAIASLPPVREQAVSLLANEVRTMLATEPVAAAVLLEVMVRGYELLERPVDAVEAMEQLVSLAPENVEHLLSLASRYTQL